MGNSGNGNLSKARKEKNDEFYTQYSDIEKELVHYVDHFSGKVVYLNCDDPEWSEFWRFFNDKFDEYGLAGLICTHYTGILKPGEKSYALERGADGRTVRTELEGDGDFRSAECVELLKRSDIVVGNAPFSLFREYVAQLTEHDKKFLVIGNTNAITYKEVWPLIQSGRLWLGSSPSFMGFRVPDDSDPRHTRYWEEADGSKWRSLGNGAWFTNLDHARRHEELPLWKKYTPEEYPKYDNYDAINVNRVKEIPVDYDGAIGVPITFLGKWNPEQFEIVGMFKSGQFGRDIGADVVPVMVNGKLKKATEPVVRGKLSYARILVKRKNVG